MSDHATAGNHDLDRLRIARPPEPARRARSPVVSATVTRDPRHPLGRLLGDTLVLMPSATGQGRTRRIPFDARHGHHVSPTHHLALLKHPEVYERLREWLQPRDGRSRATRPDAQRRNVRSKRSRSR